MIVTIIFCLAGVSRGHASNTRSKNSSDTSVWAPVVALVVASGILWSEEAGFCGRFRAAPASCRSWFFGSSRTPALFPRVRPSQSLRSPSCSRSSCGLRRCRTSTRPNRAAFLRRREMSGQRVHVESNVVIYCEPRVAGGATGPAAFGGVAMATRSRGSVQARLHARASPFVGTATCATCLSCSLTNPVTSSLRAW
jgi:hypothetical protein